MKIKHFILSLITFSFLVFSCTQEEIVPLSQNSTQETMELSTMATNTPSTTTPKAYIFVEPISEYPLVSMYLRGTFQKTPLTPIPFLGYNGAGAGTSFKYGLSNYIDMPYWYDEKEGRLPVRLPSIIEADIPQTSGGLDTYGNQKIEYNFTTVKIPKNTVVGPAWINILIPVSAMANDTKRQRTVYTYEKIGNTLVTNGSWKGWTITMEKVIYESTINYQGNRIPKGIYRVYGSYPSQGLRVNLTSNKDLYLKGNSN